MRYDIILKSAEAFALAVLCYNPLMPISTSRYQKEKKVKTVYTSIWLEPNKEDIPKLIYCIYCRCPLLQYTGDVVSIIPGGSPLKLPLIQCRNKDCGHKYYIHTIVDEI